MYSAGGEMPVRLPLRVWYHLGGGSHDDRPSPATALAPSEPFDFSRNAPDLIIATRWVVASSSASFSTNSTPFPAARASAASRVAATAFTPTQKSSCGSPDDGPNPCDASKAALAELCVVPIWHGNLVNWWRAEVGACGRLQ